MKKNPYSWLEKSLDTIHRANWYRQVKTIDGISGATITLEGQEVINFASNDYLGLASDPRLIRAACDATQKLGTGATGSRLLSGHRKLHTSLEKAIANLKGTEDALVFSSGYLANIGAIASLVGKRDLILSDQYNHSSLKNGALLSGAHIIEYPHNNVLELKQKLQTHRTTYRRCLIITDSVFSMDGDLCPLPELIDIATEFQCMLLVDEAHATGVMGEHGAGCVEHFHCTGKQLIQIGTLSKAIASLGGYIAGSRPLIEYLRNRSPTWIYTTGLSPADTAAAFTSIRIIQEEPQRRMQLWRNINYCNQLLTQKQHSQIKIIPSNSPIICFEYPDANTVLKVAQELKSQHIFAPAIRPPTVPTSRIRASIMATHTLDHIQQLVAALTSINISEFDD
ncbi:MAG: 8-amino-7-oxononanoate synthase [Cyanobacteria bacterium P01_A01_bin.45]